ncbi:hypothetical protein EW026_g594 [Hermanssonia centrifuga]|uniref:Retrovirus-related Pol polyprotein from transposon TNT 1-94-like beta-barrel domain-containing protein n=1 Tax=Hermanssonia centrifuga TaxID=98765 RepID=A0A4S4KU11_9APHY|nr:hypothetical protein EW026_g594 [Hermanssonia centrifuga]
MSSSETKFGKDYLCVPHLDVSGANWIIYKDRLQFAADARGYLDHIDGTKTIPIPPAAPPLPSSPSTDAAALTAHTKEEKKYKEDIAKHEKEVVTWKCGEGIIKQLITGMIPDSLFIKLRYSTIAHTMWTTLGCDKKDMRVHFTKLCTMQENLAAMGHPLSDDNFYAIILGSLPSSYKPYISAVTATSSVLGTTLSPNDLMLTLTEEYEQSALCAKGTRKENGGEAAFFTFHKGKAEANILDFMEGGYSYPVTDEEPLSDSKDWYPNSDDATSTTSIPSLQTVSDSTKDCDSSWPDVSSIPDSKEGSIENGKEAAYTLTFEGAFLAKENALGQELETELYDSGVTQHMSPYRHHFIDFEAIPPKPISAANNCTFHIMGKGNIDVLYAPDIGVTLVSVSHIIAAEFKVVFVKDSCSIFNPNGNLIGEIPATGVFYHVYHSKSMDYARRMKKILTIDELHCLIGHISHNAARDLVKKGLVLGVVIENSSSAGACTACKAAKTTRKPIQRYCKVKTLGERHYYVSFTDDNLRWTQIYLMRTKDKVFSHYKAFSTWLDTQHSVAVKTLHSDHGGEYLTDVLGQGPEEIPPAGHGKRVKKPSDYVRHLREGEGSVDSRGSVGNLPKGMPSVADKGAALVEEVEVAVEERAMAAVMGNVEGLEPTLEEAQKQLDWPKWLATIKAELKSLNSNDT